ncbi:MAG: hypothetical protein KKF27_20840 [Gammaproteobacteria bacterium]|nr:hypothetical protein [Gammaproteobacteria bacterium]
MLIIMDSNYICHMRKHTMGNLSHEEMATGVIFGFLQTVLAVIERFQSRRIAFAWDSRISKRKVLFPDYKLMRHKDKTPEEIEQDKIAYRQFGQLRKKVLPQLGFNNIFVQTGYEADDIIASLVESQNGSEEICIVGSDNDLYQLLKPNVFMYHPSTKRTYTAAKFVEEKGIQPKTWKTVKKIAGCKGDGVPNVPGVGEVTAIKYITSKLAYKSKAYKSITSTSGMARIRDNHDLVCLPFPGTKAFEIADNEAFHYKDFVEVCGSYGIKSFFQQKQTERWMKALEMR